MLRQDEALITFLFGVGMTASSVAGLGEDGWLVDIEGWLVHMEFS